MKFFGEMVENLCKRDNDKVVHPNEEDKLWCSIGSPSYARADIFDSNLAAMQVHKSHLVLNCPLYVAMSVLDLCKTILYEICQSSGQVSGYPQKIQEHWHMSI